MQAREMINSSNAIVHKAMLYSLLSIASTTPSGAHADMLNRLPQLPTAWWWKEFTYIFSFLYIEKSMESGSILTECVGSPRCSAS